MRSNQDSSDSSTRGDTSNVHCRRFWLPRGVEPDLSDGGFLVDPEWVFKHFLPTSTTPFHSLPESPVLALLGEPGIGKSTALEYEARQIEAGGHSNRARVLRVDLAACGTDLMVLKRIFQCREFKSWRKSSATLHLFVDGLDTCLQYVETLVALLLEGLNQEPRDRLKLRIACRTAEWPEDLEAGLRSLWGNERVDVPSVPT